MHDNPDPVLGLLILGVFIVFASVTLGAIKFVDWLMTPKRRRRERPTEGDGGDLEDIMRSRNL